MYLGLVLFPWVVFFGVSGVLFNHPGMGEAVRARPVPAPLLREVTGLAAVEPGKLASELVAQLRADGHDYRLDESYETRFHGATAFEAQGEGETHLVLIDLAAGRGVVLSRPDRSAPAAPFARTIAPGDTGLGELEPRLAALVPALELDARGPLEARVAPSLRFRMLDDKGERWNVTYDLGSGSLDGRPSERAPDLSLHDLLGAMHKTHHFPARLGPTTFWALFADLTGLTLVVWGLTGLFMWWQIKRSRALGVAGVSLGLLLAAFTMLATDAELRFGNVRPEGPGRPARH
jgi:hypothetical protein